jgi:hypothetical protein
MANGKPINRRPKNERREVSSAYLLPRHRAQQGHRDPGIWAFFGSPLASSMRRPARSARGGRQDILAVQRDFRQNAFHRYGNVVSDQAWPLAFGSRLRNCVLPSDVRGKDLSLDAAALGWQTAQKPSINAIYYNELIYYDELTAALPFLGVYPDNARPECAVSGSAWSLQASSATARRAIGQSASWPGIALRH